jgi:hypothetical protein
MIEHTIIQDARLAIVKNNLSSVQSELEQLNLSYTTTVHLNIQKKTKYEKDRVSVLLYICRSLNDDGALVDEYDTI